MAGAPNSPENLQTVFSQTAYLTIVGLHSTWLQLSQNRLGNQALGKSARAKWHLNGCVEW